MTFPANQSFHQPSSWPVGYAVSAATAARPVGGVTGARPVLCFAAER
jgi:hypothetical protein